MIMQKYKEATQRIIEILRQRGSSLVDDIKTLSDVRELSWGIRERIIDELGEEFSAKGLRLDGEPNASGLEIENLTDVCVLNR